jgi:uncharacterized membrane protein YfcA
MLQISLASLGIFIGEMYGNFVGGGSIVTQFFLQNLLDFPLKEAIALDNAAVLGSEIGLLFMLLKTEKIHKSHLIFTIFILIGSYFGAQLLHIISIDHLKLIFITAIGLVVVKSFLVKDEPKTPQTPTHLHHIALYTFATFIGAYNAFLSIGDWIFGLLGLVFLFKYPYKRSIFLLAFSLFFGRSLAVTQYFQFGYINFSFWIPMFTSALSAGLIAGHLMNRVNIDKLKPVLKILGIILAIYLSINLI